MMMKQLRFMLLTLALALFVVGCSPAGGSKGPSVSVTYLGWVNENISTTFLSGHSHPDHTAYYDFFISYDGDFAVSDLDYARVYQSDGVTYWTIADSTWTYYVNTARKVVGGWGRWYYSTQMHVLPMGTMTAEIKLKNGKISRLTRTIPAPGSTGTDGYIAMCTENLASKPSNYVAMLARANVSAVAFNAGTSSVTVTFNVNDNRVKNGEVCFYAANGDFVGASPLFVDPATGYTRAFIGTFNTNNAPNVALVDDSDISFATGQSYAAIYTTRVFLYDGKQYPTATTNSYDSSSISDGL
jgi:hypothetical protein